MNQQIPWTSMYVYGDANPVRTDGTSREELDKAFYLRNREEVERLRRKQLYLEGDIEPDEEDFLDEHEACVNMAIATAKRLDESGEATRKDKLRYYREAWITRNGPEPRPSSPQKAIENLRGQMDKVQVHMEKSGWPKKDRPAPIPQRKQIDELTVYEKRFELLQGQVNEAEKRYQEAVEDKAAYLSMEKKVMAFYVVGAVGTAALAFFTSLFWLIGTAGFILFFLSGLATDSEGMQQRDIDRAAEQRKNVIDEWSRFLSEVEPPKVTKSKEEN